MAIQALNPATGEVVKTYEPFTAAQTEVALAQARESFLTWRQLPYAQRGMLLQKAAEILRGKKEAYAKIITTEMGKPILQAIAEVEKCALVCDYYAEFGASFLADEHVVTEYKKSYIHFEPLGIILLVMPWNFPFWQVFRAAAPALMTGNTVVLKHASNVPGSALAMEQIFKEAGFPTGAFTTLLIEGAGIESVIADPRVAGVSLTGGTIAGQRVAATAGKYLKKTVMELGGSDPFIVLDDAQVAFACEEGVTARLLNAGQSCICAKRFIVEKSVLPEFLENYTALTKAQIVGDPLDPKTQMGPLAREDLLEEVHKQVQTSVQMGARLVLGGKRLPRPGAYYEPTILTDLKPGMPAYDEEIFGPVASVIEAEDENDAIRIANSSIYGLGASVWSKNMERAERVAKQLESGAVFINKMVRSDPRLPFGGVKQSGFGRELGSYGIKEFVNIKTIVLNSPRPEDAIN